MQKKSINSLQLVMAHDFHLESIAHFFMYFPVYEYHNEVSDDFSNDVSITLFLSLC